MKIIVISGSPRKGNTEWMTKKLAEFLEVDGHEVELLLLRKMEIRQCRGCLSCEAGGAERRGVCNIKDDMNATYPKLVAADAIIMGTPAYFELLSGLLKTFLDRTVPIWPHLKGKKIAGLAVAEEGTGAALQNIKTYGLLCGMQWCGGINILAKNPGDAAKVPGIESRLKGLAKKITS
jgi:multimeric flavodoxin WrbA